MHLKISSEKMAAILGVSQPRCVNLFLWVSRYSQRLPASCSHIVWGLEDVINIDKQLIDRWFMHSAKVSDRQMKHDDITTCKHVPHYWPFMHAIHWLLVNFHCFKRPFQKKLTKINPAWPKYNRFSRLSGCIIIPNFNHFFYLFSWQHEKS